MSNNTTRREALAALAGTPLLAGTIGFAVATRAEAATTDRTAWDRAFARHTRLCSLERAADKAADAARERFAAIEPSMDLIDWKTLGLPYTVNKYQTARLLDVEQDWQRFLAGHEKWWWAKDADAARAEKRAALDTILEYRRQYEEAERASGSYHIEDRADRLCDQRAEAEDFLIEQVPAPGLRELVIKMELAAKREVDAHYSAILADLRRLAAREG